MSASLSDPAFIELGLVDSNPYQPRLNEDVDAIAELAESIERNGLMQVPTVRKVGDRYQLAFGHSRLAAFKLLVNQKKTGFAWNGISWPDYCRMPLIVRELTELQMFEMAVAENIKRRALSPIEQARSMNAYMEKFGKSSEETGAFFGVSAETVRGKIRLLDLPEPAQEKLASGVITESSARTLLSVQRVATKREMAHVLDQITVLDARETPDEIIDRELRGLEGVEEMWDEGRGHGGSKPRGGYDLWPLDMKNFPNALLPELTQEDIAYALNIEGDEKLLARLRKAFEDDESSMILGGGVMQNIAQKVFTGPEGPAMIEKVQHLLTPPACTACPFYTKLRGEHYCGMKMCHARKVIAWARNELKSASRMTGIAIYNPESDGTYAVLESAWMGGSPSKKLFDAKSKDLRLILKAEVKNDHYQSGYKSVPDRFVIVVAVGAALSKLHSSRTSDNRFTPAARLQQKKDQIFKRRRKELIWLFTAAGAHLFDAMNKAVLDNIDSWKFLGVDERPPAEQIPADNAPAAEKTEYMRRLMVWNLVDRAVYRSHSPSHTKLVKVAEYLSSLAKLWDLKGSNRGLLKMAEEGDAEIAAVSIETPKKKKAR